VTGVQTCALPIYTGQDTVLTEHQTADFELLVSNGCQLLNQHFGFLRNTC